MSLQIVLYLMDARWHATRHAEGCGILARAQKAADGEIVPGRGDRPQVWEEELFARLPDKPEPRDHRCVAKVMA